MKRRFQERLARFEKESEEVRVQSLRLGWIRVGTFVAGFGVYVVDDLMSGPISTPAWIGMGLALAAFVVEVVWHRKIKARERRLLGHIRVNRMALARMERDWSVLSPSPLSPPPADHPYAMDLDVWGEGSLVTLLNTVNLPPGQEALRGWLLEPGEPGEIRRRQEAVGELAPQLDLRQEVEVEGSLVESPGSAAVNRFLAWAEEEPWLPGHRWLHLGAWVLPAVNILLIGMHVWGFVERPWWLFSVGATLVLASLCRREIHPVMDAASAGHESLERYAVLLEILQSMEARAPALRDLHAAARSGDGGGPGELRRLGRKIGWANVRENLMIHAPFQALLAWDIHALAGLEAWKGAAGSHVQAWLEAVGQVEALSALAALAGEHPEWTFPEIRQEGPPGLRAVEMGHPLLPPSDCVKNDISVGPPGSFLFLTGSNMSGKSTLLRAVGLNAVLAQAGGPVCAREMALTPLKVQTSMRTADSLAGGVSQYMAELQRIHQVVSAAQGHAAPGEGGEGGTGPADALPVLYLLDEPLQGTNEAERRVAVQIILRHLLDAGAVGAVATHDLFLDQAEGLNDAARAVHLEGRVEEGRFGPVLRFDYTLKEGRATSTNALALLRAVGLGGEPDPEKG